MARKEEKQVPEKYFLLIFVNPSTFQAFVTNYVLKIFSLRRVLNAQGFYLILFVFILNFTNLKEPKEKKLTTKINENSYRGSSVLKNSNRLFFRL